MKNILIIGCGLLGSSLLRRISKKKIAKKIFIHEKSKSNIAKIKRLKLPGTIVKSLEVSGPEHGKENMFTDRWCIIIKEKNIKKNNINILTKFWKKIGAKVVVMSAEKHDKIFSITSHLPHLIAYNLVKSAQDFEKKQNYELIKYSAGGLRDFSRIAASNEIMWRDIFFNNKNNISKAIDLFIKNLNQFKKDINSKNNKSIVKKLIQTKKVRSKIIKLKQDIDKPDFGRN